MEKDSRIFVAGEKTTAGRALVSYLKRQGFSQTASDLDKHVDLASMESVAEFMGEFKPDFIFFTGAASGGIQANQKYPADLSSQNLLATCVLLKNAVQFDVKKFFYLASSCIYPRQAFQPMKIEYLNCGPLESTSEAYAMAKLAGITLSQAYQSQYGLSIICGIAADVFGPEDSFHPEDSHVVEALIKKIHEAKANACETVSIWGSGNPVRDFIFSEDLASACVYLMENATTGLPVNISAGHCYSILQLAAEIKTVTAYEGDFNFDSSKPDGTPLKTLDADPLYKLGWRPQFSFRQGLEKTYEGFLKHEITAAVH